jgi:hypothetical protein
MKPLLSGLAVNQNKKLIYSEAKKARLKKVASNGR